MARLAICLAIFVDRVFSEFRYYFFGGIIGSAFHKWQYNIMEQPSTNGGTLGVLLEQPSTNGIITGVDDDALDRGGKGDVQPEQIGGADDFELEVDAEQWGFRLRSIIRAKEDCVVGNTERCIIGNTALGQFVSDSHFELDIDAIAGVNWEADAFTGGGGAPSGQLISWL